MPAVSPSRASMRLREPAKYAEELLKNKILCAVMDDAESSWICAAIKSRALIYFTAEDIAGLITGGLNFSGNLSRQY
jgi:hypothetical protein